MFQKLRAAARHPDQLLNSMERGLLARRSAESLELLIGPRTRFIAGVVILLGFLIWMYQNSVESADSPLKPLWLPLVPSLLTGVIRDANAAVAGLMLTASALVPGWRISLVVIPAAAVALLGTTFGLPGSLSLAAAQALAALGLFLGRVRGAPTAGRVQRRLGSLQACQRRTDARYGPLPDARDNCKMRSPFRRGAVPCPPIKKESVVTGDRQARFGGKTALVTGGGRGIGRAIARGLATEGARVVVFSRTQAELADVVRIIREQHGEAIAVAGDVRRQTDVDSAVQTAAERFGGLDILVNCAGVFSMGSSLSYSGQDWQSVLETNLTGTFFVLPGGWSRS